MPGPPWPHPGTPLLRALFSGTLGPCNGEGQVGSMANDHERPLSSVGEASLSSPWKPRSAWSSWIRCRYYLLQTPAPPPTAAQNDVWGEKHVASTKKYFVDWCILVCFQWQNKRKGKNKKRRKKKTLLKTEALHLRWPMISQRRQKKPSTSSFSRRSQRSARRKGCWSSLQRSLF